MHFLVERARTFFVGRSAGWSCLEYESGCPGYFAAILRQSARATVLDERARQRVHCHNLFAVGIHGSPVSPATQSREEQIFR